MKELMKFIKTFERYNGKINCASLAKILKSDEGATAVIHTAVSNAKIFSRAIMNGARKDEILS